MENSNVKLSLVGKFNPSELTEINKILNDYKLDNLSYLENQTKKADRLINDYLLTFKLNINLNIKEIVVRHRNDKEPVLRWFNGGGFEDGTEMPPIFWFEYRGENIKVPNDLVFKFIKENQTKTTVGIALFRDHLIKKEMTKKLWEEFKKNKN